MSSKSYWVLVHDMVTDCKISETTVEGLWFRALWGLGWRKSQGALERPGGGRHQAHGHLSAGPSPGFDVAP